MELVKLLYMRLHIVQLRACKSSNPHQVRQRQNPYSRKVNWAFRQLANICSEENSLGFLVTSTLSVYLVRHDIPVVLLKPSSLSRLVTFQDLRDVQAARTHRVTLAH